LNNKNPIKALEELVGEAVAFVDMKYSPDEPRYADKRSQELSDIAELEAGILGGLQDQIVDVESLKKEIDQEMWREWGERKGNGEKHTELDGCNTKLIARIIDHLHAKGHIRPPEPSGWQPIETAPKDGTNVLLLDVHGNYRIGGYQLNYQNRKWGTGWEGCDWDFKIDFDPQPTHWMPLPPPPTEEAE